MRQYVSAVLKSGPDILFSYFRWAIKYSINPEKFPLDKRFKDVQRLSKHVFDKLNGKLYVSGIENVEKTEVACYYSNHFSALDPVLFINTFNKPVTFLAKIEIFKYFMLGRCIRSLSGKFLDRSNLRQNLKMMQEIESDLKDKKKNWVIFAEGTRNKDSLTPIPEMHHGSFKPAMKAKVPIVPVAIYGTFRVLKKNCNHKSFPVQISYLKPIMPEEYENLNSSEVAKMVRDRIQKEIMFNLRPKDHKLMSELKDKKYRFNYNY